MRLFQYIENGSLSIILLILAEWNRFPFQKAFKELTCYSFQKS